MTDRGIDERFTDFLLWEATTRDVLDFKMAYVDMTGDIMAGLLLSQIVFWHLPNKNGDTKLRVQHDGLLWLAKSRSDWWDEIRLTPRQVDRALGILIEKGLVVTALYKFAGAPTTHIRLETEAFISAWNQIVRTRRPISPNGQLDFTDSLNPISPTGEMDITETGNSLTETTAETTTETTTELPAPGGAEIPDLPNAETAPAGNGGAGSSQERLSALRQKFGGDPLSVAATCAEMRAEAGDMAGFTVPAGAGGADSFSADPLAAFCALVGTRPDLLGERKRDNWSRKLRELAEAHSIDAAEMARCIALLPESDWVWRIKSFTSPYAGGFDEVISALILRVLADQPVATPTGNGGKQANKRRGTWTEEELEAARREALSETPIDVDAFLGESALR